MVLDARGIKWAVRPLRNIEEMGMIRPEGHGGFQLWAEWLRGYLKDHLFLAFVGVSKVAAVLRCL
jgi:hypothetical protein